ncbi:putative uncharacterized protein [Prevotella sp. CAG:487]|nr:putative uncharacterized protein [Prevotella sp. CAG:487]
MLTKIKYVLFAAALIWGSPAKAQSFLESLLDGVAKGLSSAAEQVLQQQRQSSQQTNTGVRTTDNIPPNSMVCAICKGTKKCPCGNGTLTFRSEVTGKPLTIQCTNCLGTLQCGACNGWGYVPLNTAGGTSGGTSVGSGSGSSGTSGSSTSGSNVCRLCGGTGKKIKEYYTGSAVTGKTKWCSTCNKEVRLAHYHVTCDLCKGKGTY